MALSSTATGLGILLAQLVVSAARTIVLAAGVGLLSSLFRLRVTSGRLFAWTAVLYAGLCMPVLASLVPPLSIAVPFLPRMLQSSRFSQTEGRWLRSSSQVQTS